MADSEIKSSLSGFDKKVKFNLNESNETELIGAQSSFVAKKRESLVFDNNRSSSVPRYTLDKEIASKVGNPN
jgi:hypothetical protein